MFDIMVLCVFVYLLCFVFLVYVNIFWIFCLMVDWFVLKKMDKFNMIIWFLGYINFNLVLGKN